MKVSPLSLLLLSYSIDTVNARIGSDDLHTPLKSTYPKRDLAIPREDYLPGKNQVAPKIVGGVQVDPKDRYLYQVALTFPWGQQYCGGSLIAPGWVLSAAHCALGYGSHVQIGRWDLNDDTEDYEDIQVDYELVHPDYDNLSFDNDFMLLKLKTDSQYPPVSINDGSQNSSPGTDVTTMGWGTTSFDGTSSDVLLEVEVDIVENAQCNLDYDGEITENMLCAARLGKDACQGDSGGPLVIRGNSYTEDVLVGVVSWGMGCASPNFPGVYARVSKAYNWISEYVSFVSGPTLLIPFTYSYPKGNPLGCCGGFYDDYDLNILNSSDGSNPENYPTTTNSINWLGPSGNDLDHDPLLDLGKPHSITEVKVSYIVHDSWNKYAPRSITIKGSQLHQNNTLMEYNTTLSDGFPTSNGGQTVTVPTLGWDDVQYIELSQVIPFQGQSLISNIAVFGRPLIPTEQPPTYPTSTPTNHPSAVDLALEERIINLERKIKQLEESLAFECAGGTCKGRDDHNYIIPTALIIGKENPDCTYGSPSLSVDAGIVNYDSSSTSFRDNNSGSNCPSGSGAVTFGGNTFATGDGSFAAAYGSEASGVLSSVTGGRYNSATGATSSVSGGHVGVASGSHSSVSGGYGNKAISQQSSVLGGHEVNVTGARSTGIGGYKKSCSGNYCIAQ